MKKLIFFLFFSTAVFSQNYQYAIDEVPNKTPASSEMSTNQREEIEYFNAFLLPVTQKMSIQAALDRYGSVRLEKGDYSGVNIVLHSNQRLYGHLSLTKVSNITIASGTTNVKIHNIISSGGINFQAGSAISNSEFKNIESSVIRSVGGIIENNIFINLSRCVLNWDMSNSGYFRNNKIIKHRIHAYYPQIIMKGNSSTPSYGNVQLWINMLTPGGNGAEIDNLKTLTWVGVDSESWNWYNYSNKPLIEMKNMGDVKIASISGGNLTATPTPVFDIAAENVSISRKYISSKAAKKSILRGNTNMFLIDSNSEDYDTDETNARFDFKAYFNSKNISLNGLDISGPVTDISTINKLSNTISGTQKKPWERPVFEAVPNPAGDNWKANRAGKTDQAAYIQNLINTNNIAELEEGIYYIGSTLTIRSNQGIIGKGTGKTAIVGLKDDFPLITGENTKGEVKFYLSNLTLQGGSTGLRIHPLNGSQISVSACIFRHLVFRNQNYGIHLDKFYGFDNNFIEHVSFVNTAIGFFQEVDPLYKGVGEAATMMFMDKVVFYKCQWINNTKALSLLSFRGSNLNAWIDCSFDNNKIVAEMRNYVSPLFANCNFTNSSGDYVIGGESKVEFYSCLFDKNTTNATFKLYGAYLEGCKLLDHSNLFKTFSSTAFISNSTITGEVGTFNSGMIINSNMLSNSGFNKTLVNVNSGKPTVIIDSKPNPYPQLLVTH